MSKNKNYQQMAAPVIMHYIAAHELKTSQISYYLRKDPRFYDMRGVSKNLNSKGKDNDVIWTCFILQVAGLIRRKGKGILNATWESTGKPMLPIDTIWRIYEANYLSLSKEERKEWLTN